MPQVASVKSPTTGKVYKINVGHDGPPTPQELESFLAQVEPQQAQTQTTQQNQTAQSTPPPQQQGGMLDAVGRFVQPQWQQVVDAVKGLGGLWNLGQQSLVSTPWGPTFDPMVPAVNAITAEAKRVKQNYDAATAPMTLQSALDTIHNPVAAGTTELGHVVGSVPVVGGIVGPPLVNAGQDIKKGNYAGAAGNAAALTEAILAGELADAAGNATKGLGSAFVRQGLKVPATMNRDFGDIGQAFIDTKTLPSDAHATSLAFKDAIQKSLDTDPRNLPTTTIPYDNASDAYSYVDRQLNPSALGDPDRSDIFSSLRDKYDTYLNTDPVTGKPNPAPMDWSQANDQRMAYNRLSNWSKTNQGSIQTSPVDNMWRQGLANANRNRIVDFNPSLDDALSTQQGLMGGAEAYARLQNSPQILSQEFELGMLKNNPKASAASWFLRSPDAMARTGITIDSLRNAFLNPTAGNSALIAAILGQNK